MSGLVIGHEYLFAALEREAVQNRIQPDGGAAHECEPFWLSAEIRGKRRPRDLIDVIAPHRAEAFRRGMTEPPGTPYVRFEHRRRGRRRVCVVEIEVVSRGRVECPNPSPECLRP